MYCTIGRPSIPHEQLLRALLLQALYTVRSEIAAAFFDAVVTQARDAGLLSNRNANSWRNLVRLGTLGAPSW